MELKPHQKKALDNVNKIFAEDNKAIVVHPTGTGKTYIALEMFKQNKDKKLVFISPSAAIVWQLKISIAREFGAKPEEYKKVFPNLEITTYQQVNSDFKKSETYAKDFEADIVVFDEAHHTAATEWGKNAKDLINSHPETKFLGLTATPQRPDGKDVIKDVFDGNLADEITLEEAVATRLLKMPNYITALYSYEPIIEEIELGLEAIKDRYPEKYLMLKKDMEIAKNMLEKSHGLPEIFAKHMVKKDGKYIVFCKDIKHLNKMVETAKTQGWFGGVSEKVEILAIHSEENEKTNKSVLKRFRESHVATDNTLRILFSVEKINEGLHLDDIAGEIMLRPTKSKIIYRQQLGRAMSIKTDGKNTTVFDIVNNIDSFQDLHDFMEKVIEIRIENEPDRDPEEIRKEAFDEFYMYDEIREASGILRKVAGSLEYEWEEIYQRSVKWREEHDGKKPRGGVKDKKERAIYAWERYQIIQYLKEYQDAPEEQIPKEYVEKIRKLKGLNLAYVPREYKTVDENFNIWKQWTLKHKLTPAQHAQDEEENKAAGAMQCVWHSIRKNPEKYKAIQEEYNGLCEKYGRNKDYKTPEEHFKIWKRWTLEHKITPSQTSKDETERKTAKLMMGGLKKARNNPKQYKTLIQEYNKLCKKYGREREYKKPEEHFKAWKQWTTEHKITPSQTSKDETERKIANGIHNALQTMKNHPRKYKKQLEEYDSLRAQYGRYKLKSLQQQKQQELSETKELKAKSEQVEALDTQTQTALDQAIDEQTQKPKGPGEQ